MSEVRSLQRRAARFGRAVSIWFRRRWHRQQWRRRVVARALVGVVLLLVLAGATLPWWFPTERIKAYLIADLSRQTGTAVHIDRVSLGWRSGIEIYGLRIDSPEGFEGVPVAGVERIHTEFNPIRLLMDDEIKTMTLDGPWVNAVFNESGQSNVTVLSGIENDIEVRNISIRDARARLELPGNDQTLDLAVDSAAFQAGRLANVGTVTVSARLQQPDDPAAINLYVDSAAAENMAAKATFAFRDLDLAPLGLPKLLSLPVKSLAGRCSGSLDLEINRRGVVEQAQLELDAVSLEVVSESGEVVPDLDSAHIQLGARYDPVAGSGEIDLREIDIRLANVLVVTGRAKLDPTILQGSMSGINSLDIVVACQPAPLAFLATGSWVFSDVRVAGPVVAQLNMHQRDNSHLVYALTVDAGAAALYSAAEEIKPAGRTCEVLVEGQYSDRNDLCTVANWQVMLGGNDLRGDAQIRNFSRWRERWADAVDASDWLVQLSYMQGSVEGQLNDLAALAQMMPDSVLLGSISAEGPVLVSGSLVYSPAPRVKVAARVPNGTTFRVAEVFAKPADIALVATVIADIDTGAAALVNMDGEVLCGLGDVDIRSGSFYLPTVDRGATFDADVSMAQVEAFAACVRQGPDDWTRWVTGTDPQGSLGGTLSYAGASGTDLGGVDIAFDTVALSLRADRWSADVTGAMAATLTRDRDGVATRVLTGTGLEIDALTDMSRMRKAEGVLFRVKAIDGPTGEEYLMELGRSAVAFASLDGSTGTVSYQARVRIDPALLAAAPQITPLVDDQNLAGEFTVRGRIDPSAESVVGVFDGDGLTWDHEGSFVKAAQVPLAFRFELVPTETGRALTVDSGRLGPLQFASQAAMTDAWEPTNGGVSVSVADAGGLGTLWPGLADTMRRGSGEWVITWVMMDAVLAIDHDVTLSDWVMRYRDESIELSGPVWCGMSISPREPDTALGLIGAVDWPARNAVVALHGFGMAGFKYALAGQEGFVIADIHDMPDRLAGRVEVLAGRVDVPALSLWLTGEEPVRPDSPTMTDEETAVLDARVAALLDRVTPILLASDLEFSAEIDELVTYDLMIEARYELINAVIAGRVDEGLVDLTMVGGLNSGSLRRSYRVDLNEESPTVHYLDKLDEVEPRSNVQPQIEYTFPGNKVTGLFTHTETWEMDLSRTIANSIDYRYPLRPVGPAVSVAIEGVAEGQAAPEYITKQFPGLKTTHYPYRMMTAFSEHRADGTVESDMIFDGEQYDTYMQGEVSPDHVGKFEIGVILLSEVHSAEWQHEYRQGRIPLLMFEGRIVDGTMQEVDVDFPKPNETLYSMFLRNNYFYRSWLVRQARQQASADSSEN